MLDQISLAQMVTRNTKTEKGTYLQKLDTSLQPKRSNCRCAADPGDKEKVKGNFTSGAVPRGISLNYLLKVWMEMSVGGWRFWVLTGQIRSGWNEQIQSKSSNHKIMYVRI